MLYRNLRKTFRQFDVAQIILIVMMPLIIIPSLYELGYKKSLKPEFLPYSNNKNTGSEQVSHPRSPSIPTDSPKVDFSFDKSKQSSTLQEKISVNNSSIQDRSVIATSNLNPSISLKGVESLQKIVDEAVLTIQDKGLPVDKLSISLINVKNSQCQPYAKYQDQKPRFPASVSKLFWMVALYDRINNKMPLYKQVSRETVRKMIQKSDNEAASDVVDAITGADSGETLDQDQLSQWREKRKSVNLLFNQLGYPSVDVSQKNFPIPKLEMTEPKGRDLQIRGNESLPIRNSLTTYDVTRLAYEIHSRRAVSPELSERMEGMMVRNLDPNIWKQEQYNSIEGFLAEKLPLDTYVASKVGWTSGSRQDVAIIHSSDGLSHYILTIFGDDKKFADDWDIFPAVSRQVFERMKLPEILSCGASK
jgi:hypothetical protein